MQTLSEIRALLAERGLRPRHRFGQNFLHDHNQLKKLVDAAGVAPGDLVLEIGPGTGTLTEALLDAGARVITCEIDRDLADLIEERLGDRVTLVRGDCLESGRRLAANVRAALGDEPFVLVANLPYQVASPIMSTLLIDEPNCRGQYVTIQKEVGDRLTAGPGTKAYGPLGIIIQACGAVERIAVVKPGSFWPAPKVTSAMVAIRRAPRECVDDAAGFARFITELFGKRRKQLGTVFPGFADWPEGVTAQRRGETLSVDQLAELWRAVRDAPRSAPPDDAPSP